MIGEQSMIVRMKKDLFSNRIKYDIFSMETLGANASQQK